MMEATDRAAQRAARIRALQLTGLQSQRAQLGALEAAAAAAQREIAALEAELRKPPKRSSHLGRAQPGDHADVSHLKQKLEAMSVSDLVELQRHVQQLGTTRGQTAPAASSSSDPPPSARLTTLSKVEQQCLDRVLEDDARAQTAAYRAADPPPSARLTTLSKLEQQCLDRVLEDDARVKAAACRAADPPPSARSTAVSKLEQRCLERAAEDEALADAAMETAKAAAGMAANQPSAEEQEWMEGEMRKASEQQSWLERQASDAARRVIALKTTLLQQHNASGEDADHRPLAAALPSPFSDAQERWLASEVQAHMQREASAAAAIQMTQAAAAAGQPSSDEQEWLEQEIGKAEDEHVWLERQASDAARRVAALSKIVSPRHSADGRVPLAAALPSPLTAAQERWLALEVDAHTQRAIAEDAAVEIARAMQDSAPQHLSDEEQAWLDQQISRAAEEHTWLERQASDARRRLLELHREAAVEATAAAPRGVPQRSSQVSNGGLNRPSFDRPLLPDASTRSTPVSVGRASEDLHRPLMLDTPARSTPVSDGAVGRAFEDLHRIREQLAAVRRISLEADEVLDAMDAGSLQTQPRLQATLQQLHHDCGRLRAEGQSVLSAMAGAGPAARAAALQASEALSQASDALRERIQNQLRVFGLAEERQAILHGHTHSR